MYTKHTYQLNYLHLRIFWELKNNLIDILELFNVISSPDNMSKFNIRDIVPEVDE